MTSDGYWPDELAELLQQLLDEPRPAPPPPVDMSIFGLDRSPMDWAGRGFGLAVEAVSSADYALRTRDWEDRQQKAWAWSERVSDQRAQVEVAPLTVAVIHAEVSALLEHRSRRERESALMMGVVGKGHRQIGAVIDRTRQRLVEVLDKARKRIGEVPPENVQRQQALVLAVQHEIRNISEIGVKRINTQTRRVLDMDESTSQISVAEWLNRHGIDASQPPVREL